MYLFNIDIHNLTHIFSISRYIRLVKTDIKRVQWWMRTFLTFRVVPLFLLCIIFYCLLILFLFCWN